MNHPPTSKTNDWQLKMLAQDNSREEQVDDDDYDDDTGQTRISPNCETGRNYKRPKKPEMI
jgi:hypothetical protein